VYEFTDSRADVLTNCFDREVDGCLHSRRQRSAEERCPSLKRKRVTPHVLRHTAAMQLLRHGIDRSVIALWLGHESVETTQIYLHADLRQKEEAITKVAPLDMPPGRFRPDDELLAFLEGL
jgi:integrase/recombinase XerD